MDKGMIIVIAIFLLLLLIFIIVQFRSGNVATGGAVSNPFPQISGGGCGR